MPELKTYDLFISHAWKLNDEYYRLRDLLKSAALLKWRDYSVPEHDPLGTKTKKELLDALDRQIRPVNAFLLIAGMYLFHREWIQAEISIAQRYSKPIIGIRPRGAERVPIEVEQTSVEMVSWNTDSIVAAIRRHAL